MQTVQQTVNSLTGDLKICRCLDKSKASQRSPSHLVMHQDVHNVVVDLRGHPSLRLVGQQDVLDPQERHQDERGPHGFHVEAGLRLVGDLQFGDEHSHNVQQKEQVDLRGDSSREGISKLV